MHLSIYVAVSGLSCDVRALDCWLSSCGAHVAPLHVESRDPTCAIGEVSLRILFNFLLLTLVLMLLIITLRWMIK